MRQSNAAVATGDVATGPAADWHVGDRCKFLERTRQRRFTLRYGTIVATNAKTATVELEPPPHKKPPKKPPPKYVRYARLQPPDERINLHAVMLELELHLIGKVEHGTAN